MGKSITYVVFDLHKNSIDVAFAEGSREDEVRHYDTVNADMGSVYKLVRKLVSQAREPRFVYEAGRAAMRFIGT